MSPIEKYESNCTVVVVTPQQIDQQQYDISLSEFSDIYNEYLSDNSETTSTSDTDSSTSASISKLKHQKIEEDFERLNSQANANKRNKLNQLFGVQIEVTSLLLEAERRKLKVLQQELNLSLDECDQFARNKHNHDQCHELILAIS